MKWISYLPMAIRAFLAVIPLVKALVETFETPGFGAEKKEQVMQALDIALTGLDITGKIKQAALKFADWLIDTIVLWKHMIGEFKHVEEE